MSSARHVASNTIIEGQTQRVQMYGIFPTPPRAKKEGERERYKRNIKGTIEEAKRAEKAKGKILLTVFSFLQFILKTPHFQFCLLHKLKSIRIHS